MDIWKGSVDVPYVAGATQTLENLCLSTDLNAPPPTTWITDHLRNHISKSSFSFLSYLPPLRIPLFLAAGPSLQVTTTSPATCSFFRKLFLSALPKADVEEETPEQSRIALLLRVHADPSDSLEESNPGDWGITEILIYGAVTYPTPPSGNSSTPPHSSPDPLPVPIVSVHALPLSSRHNFAAYIQVKPEPDQEGARYIAPNPQDVLNPFISRSTKKRRADALDRVVDKKVKKRKTEDGDANWDERNVLGGRNSNTGSLPSPRNELPDLTGSPLIKKRKSIGSVEELRVREKGLQRANSMFNLSDRKSTALTPRPRSSSSQLAEKMPIKKEPDAIERSGIESKNRDLLNKVVLEEMRRRGLKDYRRDKDQRAKSTMSTMPAGEEAVEVAVLDEENEQWRKWEAEREEYKGVFHHSVKAAMFALRHDGFSEVTIAAERMRRTVNLLLSVFLGDGQENDVDEAADD